MNRDEIIKLAAHEMKTPISIIHGYAELIKYDIIKSAEIKETTEKMQRETIRMAKLVDELEVYFLLEENKYNFDFRDVDLKALLIDAVIPKLKNDMKTLMNVSVEGSGVVHGDADLIRMLVSHIIENGIKYNTGEEKKVICTIEHTHNGISLIIEDNGMGIREEEREEVFKCFYRVNKPWSREKGSNGMGLPICKKIAEAHGAKLSMDSIFEKGTKVTVEF